MHPCQNLGNSNYYAIRIKEDIMRFAISIPQFVADGEFDPAGLRAYLARAEALGFDSAWTLEQVLGTMPTLGPMETMTYAAACTERIRLGCVVFVTPLHSPVHLAKSLSTLDQVSRGRIEVGVGTGGRDRMFSAFEVDPASLVARFTEGLRLMKALWTEPRVTFEGRFWQLDGAAMEPKPFQKPHPPIWFGANHPAALRRAVRYGDGFFGAGSTTTAQFAEQVRIVREALAEAGRDPASFRIAKRIYIAVDDDAEYARQHVAASLVRFYGAFGRRLEPAAVSGPPDACVEGVREVAEAGAELILFTPFFNEAEQMERLAAEVAPKLL
jgi:probable F420-dependent oxidoreductase